MPAVVLRQVRDNPDDLQALPHTEWLRAHDLPPEVIFAATCALKAGEPVKQAPPAAVEWAREDTQALVFLTYEQADAVARLLRPAGCFLVYPAIREKPMPRRDAPRLERATPPARRPRLARCRRPHSTDWHVGKPNCGVE